MGVSDEEMGKLNLDEANSVKLINVMTKKLVGMVTGTGSS